MKKIKRILMLLLAFCLLMGVGIQAQAAKKSENTAGKWIYKGSYRMYRLKDGTYAKDTWLTIKGKKYVFDEKGKAQFGLVEWKGNTYYVTRKQGRVTGWVKIKNARYYFKWNGKMVKAQFVTQKGKTYYLRKNGKMAKGWITVDGKRYYMDKEGVMVTGEQWIKGKWYYFKKNGVYDPKKKITSTVNPNKPMVALTFDDGPGPYTNRLLDALKKYNAKATFFLVGRSIPNYSSVVKRAYRLGCEIGSHTYSHPMLSSLSDGGIQSEMNKTNSLIKSLTGQSATVMRPPYGDCNNRVLANLTVPAIMWSIDTRDWEHRNPSQTISITMSQVQDGSIILMHDIHEPSVQAAEKLIPMLQEKGYQLVTVTELAKYKGQKLSAGQKYYSIN